MQRFRPLSIRFWRKALFVRTVFIASVREAESPGCTVSAASPTTSGREPAFVHITGVPAAMLSSVV